MTSKALVVFASLLILVFGAEKGEKCINRNGERATCTSILSCKAVIHAMARANGARIRVSAIKCGFDKVPLVCCQTAEDFAYTSANNTFQEVHNSTDDLDIIMDYTESVTIPSVILVSNNVFSTPVTEIGGLFTSGLHGTSGIKTASPKPLINPFATQLDEDISILNSTADLTNSPNALSLLFETDAISTNNSHTIVDVTTPLSNLLINPSDKVSSISSSTENATDTPNFVPLAYDGPAATNIVAETVKDIPTTVSSIFSTESTNLARKRVSGSVKKLLPDRNTCGLQTERRLLAMGIAHINEFPWVTLLRYRDGYGYDAGFRCTATLINDKYVVSAAHCVVDEAEYLFLDSVRLGEWVISSPVDCVYDFYREECSDRVLDLGIKKKIPHPQYDYTCKKNDIALIEMDKKIEYTGFIRPICLPVQNLSTPGVGTLLTTSGWGTSAYGHFVDVKSKTQISVWNNYECRRRLWGFSRAFDDQICIAKLSPNDMCMPDSGGPIMEVDKEGRPQWYLEGIMSIGAGCSKENYFGIYTRVTNHIEWILKILTEEAV